MHWEYEINKDSRATPAGNTALRVQGIHLGTDQWLQDAGEGLGGTGVTQCFWMGLPGDTVQKKEGLSPWRCSEKLQIQGGTGTSAEWAGIEPRNSQKTH